MKKLQPSEYIYFVIGWTVCALFFLLFAPFCTMQYRGIGADSQERVYINQESFIGVYSNGAQIGKVSLDDSHLIYKGANQFFMLDDKIFVSKSGSYPFDVLDLEGNWLGYSESGSLTAWEMNEHEMKNGDLLVLEDKPFLPAKAVRYKTDGSEETVFREPLLQYGLKLSIPAVWVLYFGWQIRESHRKKKEWEAQFAARQNPTEK